MRSEIAGVAVILGLLVFTVPPAEASTTGDCVIILQGQDASNGSAQVDVPESGDVSYHIVSPVPVVRWTVKVHYGPLAITALDQEFPADGSNVREGVASVNEFTKYGAGRYEVTGDAQLADGRHCTAQMELLVPGSPFKSVIGLTAMAMFGAGVVGFLALLIQILLQVNDVRSAIKDFVGQAKETKEDAAAATTAKPPDPGEHPPGDGPPQKR